LSVTKKSESIGDFRMGFKFNTALAGACFALVAMPAAAQVAMCGGVGAAGEWVGGTPEASDISTVSAALDQAGLVSPGGEFVSLFSLSETTSLRLEAMGQFGGDTVIDLRDEGGSIILSDDDSGGMMASRGEITLDPGTYCMSTRSFGGGPLMSDIRIGRTEHEPLTEGTMGYSQDVCTGSTPATPLGSGGMLDDQLADGVTATSSIADTPYYRFTLGSNQPVTIRAENQSADPYLYVYDSNGNLIDQNDDYDSLDARIDFTGGLAAGTYCLGLRALSDETAPVTVSIATYDAASGLRDMYSTADASPPLDGSHPYTDLGILQNSLVTDVQVDSDAIWYSFTVPEGGLILINAIGVGNSDPIITLFDRLGRLIERNDDFGGTFDAQIATQVSRGQYVLGISQYSTGSTGMIRLAMERYVPAE
jgi:hypothetical protein